LVRSNLVSGPVLVGEAPVCSLYSLLGQFRFSAAFNNSNAKSTGRMRAT
jgi:hypothetical protein